MELTLKRKRFRFFKAFLLNEFSTLRAISHMFLFHNISWQLDTIIICYQRGDNYKQKVQSTRTSTFKRCMFCRARNHATHNCSAYKTALHKRRLESAYNPRKENQCGPYANRSPFHLLTEVLIPDEVFG